MRTFSLLSILTGLALAGCGAATAGDFGADAAPGDGDGNDDDGAKTDTGGGEGTDDEEDEPDTDGEADTCPIDCGEGQCVGIDDAYYCDCPEGTQWGPDSCDSCPVLDAEAQSLDIAVVTYSGRFMLDGQAPPASEYDDANIWLENSQTKDRVHVGNTHDGDFTVRVTPGLYDLVYESETAGNLMPHNGRAILGKVPLFSDRTSDVEVPLAARTGTITLNAATPPESEYDDGLVLFRDVQTGDEVLAANTHEGGYSVLLIPGDYEIVYRVETAGELMPRNVGARLDTVHVEGLEDLLDIDIPSVSLTGSYTIGGGPAPASEYDDGNIEFASLGGGKVLVGNTHDQNYAINVIPDVYEVFWMHETGADVPQNRHARLYEVDVNESGELKIDVPMIQMAGVLTINGGAPPADEFDDGVLSMRNEEQGDEIVLGNTHAGSYAVKIVPGDYDVFYAQETAGGTVPQNKAARLGAVAVPAPMSVDIDVDAVPISGGFTINGAVPPSSQYEDGRVYLRNVDTGDSLLLGSTHEGSFDALVVPGTYRAFYSQETGGEAVPGNHNAGLGEVQIGGAMNFDLDVPMTQIEGFVLANGEPAPKTPSDGGQLYLRDAAGDAVYVGTSYGDDYAAKLVSGTYGVYYRSGESLTMPENENGRFMCFTVN